MGQNIPVNFFVICIILMLTFGFSDMASNFQDTKSEDEKDVEGTQNEKEFMDFVLDNTKMEGSNYSLL